MVRDSNNLRQYVEIPDRDWNQETVLKLLATNPRQFLDNLPSIMQVKENEKNWKVRLATSLLESEIAEDTRCRLWSALCIRARFEPTEFFATAAGYAWRLIDNSDRDSAGSELESVQQFLEDIRVFMFGQKTDHSLLQDWASSSNRFRIFTGIRAMSAYCSIHDTTQLITGISESEDFVIRESVVNSISIIYSREDCSPDSVGRVETSLDDIIHKAKNDSSWYVRKAAETATFFREQYLKEFSQ